MHYTATIRHLFTLVEQIIKERLPRQRRVLRCAKVWAQIRDFLLKAIHSVILLWTVNHDPKLCAKRLLRTRWNYSRGIKWQVHFMLLHYRLTHCFTSQTRKILWRTEGSGWKTAFGRRKRPTISVCNSKCAANLSDSSAQRNKNPLIGLAGKQCSFTDTCLQMMHCSQEVIFLGDVSQAIGAAVMYIQSYSQKVIVYRKTASG